MGPEVIVASIDAASRGQVLGNNNRGVKGH